MRVAFFIMSGASVLRESDATVSSLLDLGVDLTLVQFWSGEYFPVESLRDGRLRYTTLADTGFPGFPRLPRWDYERVCGADFDPIGINVHEFVREQYPIARGFIHIDSYYYQQYYSAAFRIGTFLDTLRPELVIVQGGSDALQKLVRVKCGQRRIPVLGWETAFFPGCLLLDPEGMHFFPGANKIDRDWPVTRDTPLTAEQAGHLASFLATWRQQRSSKYPQVSADTELRALDHVARRGQKIAFLPGQIPWDASVLTGPYGIAAYDAYLHSIRAAVPDGWCLVHKVHPLDPRGEAAAGVADERFLPVRKVSIHELFTRADVVVTHSSNVGLEALMCGRPVVCLAAPHYARKGLTLDVEQPADLGTALDRGVTFEPPQDLLDRFLHYLIADYLIPAGDVARLRARLDDAHEAWPAHTGPTPFETAYPARAARHREMVREYNRQAFENRVHHHIVEALSRDDRFREFAPAHAIDAAWDDLDALHSGRRQVCTRLEELRPDTHLRYALAGHLALAGAPAGARILDFGCGVGYGSYLLSLVSGARVDAIDASAEAMAFARQHWSAPAVAHRHASAANWQRPDDDAYDLVVSFETLEHMPNPERFLEMLWSVTQPGGLLIVSSFNRAHFALRDNPYHVRHFSPQELRDLMGRLEGACWIRVLGQENHGPIIEGTETSMSVALAVKDGAQVSETVARIETRLRDLMPLMVPPTVPEPGGVRAGVAS
jgi:2-polyprenyl-3-methyl-5-hydroxy-6-metoxy-1,4-benzoquinol methylase